MSPVRMARPRPTAPARRSGDPEGPGVSGPLGRGVASPEGPVRTCVGCRRRAPATSLVRVACSEGGSLVLSRSAPGRGAWLCATQDGPDPDCVDAADRRKAWSRALRSEIDPGSVPFGKLVRGTGPKRETMGPGAAEGAARGGRD